MTQTALTWFWWRFEGWQYTIFAAAVTTLSLLAFLPEYKQYIRLRLQGDYQSKDLLPMLEKTDMGRPLKYMRKYGLIRGHPEDMQSDDRKERR